MDFNHIPVGFGLALSSNTAAMNRCTYFVGASLTDRGHSLRSLYLPPTVLPSLPIVHFLKNSY